ncbi:site-specific DNA-methyltransferase [Enorma sp.]|uniref:site-specific DNA-methyltransferase n=1 Tax=Enorma sp. TaxID=1920692 RepID=UPI003AB11B49
MEKLSHASENILDENVEKLAELFPEVVTEVREPDGSLRHTIDVEALKARVGDVAEGQRERYQFIWPGKRNAKQEAYRQIDKCLRPCPEESVNWDTTENLYIEGDNLDALKLLRNTYAGKIKMIYIDPPYNTGSDRFIYDDKRRESEEEFRSDNAAFDDEGNLLDLAFRENRESNGRFHSDWCSMMYPRLLLARDLLSEDGVLFVSIDDSEFINLEKLVQEVFGSPSLEVTFIWKSKSGGANDSGAVAIDHEYILAVCKTLNQGCFGLDKHGKASTNYSRSDEHGRFSLERLDKQNLQYSQALDYVIVGPDGREYTLEHRDPSRPNAIWRWSKDRVTREIDQLVFENGHVYTKNYEKGGVKPRSLLVDERFGRTRTGSSEVRELLTQVFDNPKPTKLLSHLIEISAPANSIILDFFSGSATTAHAVMKLNAEDGGNRKFIMVQLPEICDEKSEAAKAGYKNICEIGKERIRRAGKKIAEEVEESNRQLKLGEEPKRVPDIGFRVLKIDSSNFEDVAAEPAAYTQQMLAGLADNLKPGRTAEDILFQVMPQFQIPLSAKIVTREINGSMVFSADDGRLVACFDRNVSTETIVAMAKMEPDYAVMRDASFSGDDAVSNFGELFKTYSPATITRVV